MSETTLAEKDAEIARLRSALEDLMSWFADKPEPAEWRITAGEYGADAAIAHARSLLGTSDEE